MRIVYAYEDRYGEQWLSTQKEDTDYPDFEWSLEVEEASGDVSISEDFPSIGDVYYCNGCGPVKVLSIGE